MKKPPKVSKEKLVNLYVNQQLSIHKVGAAIGKSGDTISRWLKYYGINIRNDPNRYNKYRTPLLSNIKEFIIGSMLGDGNLDYHKGSRSESCRLRFCHGLKQIEYLKWKKDLLGDLVQQDIIKYKQKDRNSIGCSIQSIKHPEFVDYYHLFYNGDIKVIPKDIADMVTEFGLAVWVMDDAWKCKRYRSMKICTDSFTFKENELLVNVLEKFGITSRIYKNGDHWRLSLGRDDLDLLSDLIKPFVIKSMMSKVT